MGLIDVLASADRPMQLKDIAVAARMPAAKAHRYLASFVACGMVVQSQASNRYDLGPMALRVGVSALNRFDVIDRAGAGLVDLRDDIWATCFTSAWSDKGPIILRWEDSRRALTVIVHVGSTMPLLSSATGRAFLAFLPPELTASLLQSELEDSADAELVARIDAVTRETRASGLGRTLGEFQADIAALAAPLYDPLGRMVGAVTALGCKDEFDAAYDGTVAQKLRAYTARLAGER